MSTSSPIASRPTSANPPPAFAPAEGTGEEAA